ncbi:LuxR C-terminal-related transcriptional regulator [Mycobacterium sp. 1274761.0]|uniref:helix-turn-helix transcriptional regulator n=1 Tax=Mycobacterium sp. 1274761.0 TaxID=1834077 RepID=UPI0012E959A1|nr:LuxR family transcriptional regulator [Mycobacterium sp. 1274761.0]
MSEPQWNDVIMGELPTGTVTLLLADVEGSTRLWQTQPEEMTAAVARLDTAVARLLTVHDGVRPVEQGEGDSFVAAFARASDAVACALALQQAPLAPIRLRIGVHTGQVQLRDEGNYIGPTINRTARLRDLAHGGQTVLSAATEQLVADWLPKDAWLTDLGTHELRDLPRPERVTQLCHPDLRNDFPPLRASKSTESTSLPAQLTSFVGRVTQMAEIRDLLANNRMVTLTGAGGAGKTRLAIEVAGGIGGDFRDGVSYVDLAPITHEAVVPVAVARALGLPDQPGRTTMDSLVRFIGDRRTLMLLDNCEHLLDATAALAAEALATCPGLHILATSRESTGVPGEVTFQVPSLSLDDEALELFADRARRVRPDFCVSAENVATVTEICRRLDGLPLAIELAAARVRALSLDEIVDSLHRFRLLTGGSRTAVRRQQTLRASVDWSHALLTEPERILFRRLAVFLGGFDLDAAQAVAGDAEVERYQILDQLALLVDKSLVNAQDTNGRTRYRLLETVRQYAQEKLGESGEAEAVRSRHRDHYTSMAALLDSPARSDYDRLVEHADEDMDNLRSAFAWSIEAGDIASAVELASSLQPLWLSRGRIQEGIAWLDVVLNDKRFAQAGPAVRAKGLADKAVLGEWVGIYHVDDAQQALTIARELDDPGLLVRSLIACGGAAVYDAAAAERYLVEANGLARELGDPWRLSQILCQQAQAAFIAGDVNGVIPKAEEGRDISDAVGNRFGSRQCRWRLAGALAFQGSLSAAVGLLNRLLEEAEADHDSMLRVTLLFMLPHVLAFRGEPDAAIAAAREAISSAAEIGDLYIGNGYSSAMVAYMAAGDIAAAAEAENEAWSHLKNYPELAALQMAYIAGSALARADLTVARPFADNAVAGCTGWYRAVALRARARIAILDGDAESAERDVHDSLACGGAVGAYLFAAEDLEILASLATRAGSHLEAARLFGAAEGIRMRTEEVRSPIYQGEYDAVLAECRNALGKNDFQAAWDDGAALSTTEAIAYAQRGRGERKRPSSGWASLTPAEMDVVRLVSEGLGNKDVAARLFVSPRTVQSHLTRVYTKLGLTSRVQLAQEAARRTDTAQAR